MNKKGFTLIELLAIIIILGIIALIAIPSISSVVEESKKEGFKNTANNLVDFAKKTCTSNIASGKFLKGQYFIVDGKVQNLDLKMDGELPEKGILTIDDDCNIAIYAESKDGKYYVVKGYSQSKVVIHNIGESSPELDEYDEIPIAEDSKSTCFNYEDLGDEVIITGYKYTNESCPRDIVIPSTIDDKKVTKIADFAFIDKNRFAKTAYYENDPIQGNTVIKEEVYRPGMVLDNIYNIVEIQYSGVQVEKTNCYVLDASGKHVLSHTYDGVYERQEGDGYSLCRFSKYTTTDLDDTPLFEIDSLDFSHALFLDTIPVGVADNSHLKRLKIGNHITKIESSAFHNNMLTELEIPDNLTVIGSNAFSKNSITSLDLNNVTVLGRSTFSYNNIDSLTISKTSIIPAFAFQNNVITNLIVPEGVEHIQAYAFSDCDIVSATLPNSLKTLGMVVFAPQVKEPVMTNITLGNGLEYIGYAAFATQKMSTINIPSTVRFIGDQAFTSCPNLTSINIPEGVEYIGEYIFQNNKKLASVTLPSTLKTIALRAFENDSALTNISFPDGLKEIGDNAFNGTKVTSFLLPNSVEKIGQYVCYNCPITKLTLSNKLTEIPTSAFGYIKVGSITIPDSVKKIGASSFIGNAGLTKLTIGANVTEIGNSAFNGHSLKTLTIPNKVTKIGSSAFKNSSAASLKTITIGTGIKTIGSSAFEKTNGATITINKPEGSVTGSPWGATNPTINWVG